jgi:RimJ/RimL family protein N-acetyltransferase
MSIIKIKNFKLRSYKSDDTVSLIKNINNKKIYRYTTHIPYPYTLKHAKDWLKKCRDKSRPSINFAIDIGGEVIGGIGLSHIEKNYKAEIGYWLAEQYWNQDIITSAVKLIVRYGFKNLRLKRIYAYVLLPNQASARVLQKSGFKQEGLLRKHFSKDGKIYDVLVFGKV